MITKTLTLIGGLMGAAFASQYPEFTQQYTQRLGGEVAALTTVVADFDASARKAEMSRDEALASMGGSVFLENRRADIRNTIARQERLSIDLQVLQAASPLERLTMPQRVADTPTARATWEQFRPALPLSLEGVIAAGVGFAFGYLLLSGLIFFLRWPFTRRKPSLGLKF